MAINQSLLASSGDSANNVSTYSTASISPAAHALLIVAVTTTISGGTTVSVSGLGLTWTQRATAGISSSTDIAVFTAQCGPSPGSGALTLTFSSIGSQAAVWDVLQVTGHDTTNAVVQAPSDNGSLSTTSPLVSFATAAGADNRMFFFCGINSNTSQTPRANWTELSDHTVTSPSCNQQVQWRSDATDTAGSSTPAAGSGWGAVGLEIQASASNTVVGAATLSARGHLSVVQDYDSVVFADAPLFYLANDSGEDIRAGRLPTIISAPTSTTLPNGHTALAYDGVDDTLQFADEGAFSIPTTGELTAEAWIRPDVLQFTVDDGNGYIHWLGKSTFGSPNQTEWQCRMYSLTNPENRPNRISCYVFNISGGLGVGSFFEDPVTVGEWIHVVAVYNFNSAEVFPGGHVRIYKNGVLRDTDDPQELSIIPENGTAPLFVGGLLDSQFEGAIGKVALYDYELSAAQIAAHYQAMTSTDVPGTASLSSDSTFVATASAEVPGSAILSAATDLTVAARLDVRVSSALAGDTSFTAAGAIQKSGSASLSAEGALTAAADLDVLAASALSADSDLQAASKAEVRAATTLTTDGTLTASGRSESTGTAGLASDGALTAAGHVEVRAATALAAESTLSANGNSIVHATAALDADGALELLARADAYATAALLADGTLTAIGTTQLAGTASLGADSNLTASASVDVLGAVALTAHSEVIAAAEQRVDLTIVVGPSRARELVTVSASRTGLSTGDNRLGLTAADSRVRERITVADNRSRTQASAVDSRVRERVTAGDNRLGLSAADNRLGLAADDSRARERVAVVASRVRLRAAVLLSRLGMSAAGSRLGLDADDSRLRVRASVADNRLRELVTAGASRSGMQVGETRSGTEIEETRSDRGD